MRGKRAERAASSAAAFAAVEAIDAGQWDDYLYRLQAAIRIRLGELRLAELTRQVQRGAR